jgi:hypothetical protein
MSAFISTRASSHSAGTDLLRVVVLVAVVIASVVVIGATDAWWTLVLAIAALLIATAGVLISVGRMLSDEGDAQASARHSR